MNDFIKGHRRRQREQQNAATTGGLAVSSAPFMVKRLVDQIVRDVEQFAAVLDDPIAAYPRSDGVQVERNYFPAVSLDVQWDQSRNSVMHCATVIRKNAGVLGTANTFDIQIIAASQTRSLYRIGADDLDEFGASSRILRPLLEANVEEE